MWSLDTTHIIGRGYGEYPIYNKCNNLAWGNDRETLCTTLTFDSILDLAEGRSHLLLMRDGVTVFEGVIVSKVNKTNIHSYTAMDFAMYLNKNKKVMQFNSVKADVALNQICANIGLKCNIIPLSTVINKIYFAESLSDIIKDILEQCKNELGINCVLEMNRRTLYINSLTDLKLDTKLIIGKDYTVSRSMESMQNRVIALDQNGKLLADVKDQDNIDVFGELSQDFLTVEQKNESQATNLANNMLNEKNKTKKEITFNTIDTGDGIYINANRMVEIKLGKYGVDGWFRIKSTSHTLTNNIHKIAITIDFS